MDSLAISYEDGSGAPSRPATSRPATKGAQARTESSRTDAASTGTDVESDEDTTPRPRRRSRRRALSVLFGVVALLVFLQVAKLGFGRVLAPSTATDSQAAALDPKTKAQGASALEQIVADAIMFRAERNTFAGFSAPGALVASGRDNLVVSAVVDGTCFYAGVLAGDPKAVLADPSGKACTSDEVATAQRSIDQGEATVAGIDQISARSRLDQVAQLAPSIASVSNGSLASLGSAGLDNVQVVSAAGNQAVLQTPIGDGRCLRAALDANGLLTDSSLTPC